MLKPNYLFFLRQLLKRRTIAPYCFGGQKPVRHIQYMRTSAQLFLLLWISTAVAIRVAALLPPSGHFTCIPPYILFDI